MKFQSDNFYHIFNRGNNKVPIFLEKRNYEFFRLKIKELISPYCEIVAYCLMPNHFHLLIYTNDASVTMLPNGVMQNLERKIGTLQSSYTRAINMQEKRTGGLFQQKCKMIELNNDHPFICFHYIHQNPMKAGLVKVMEDWEHSSYLSYLSNKTDLCNQEIAFKFLEIPEDKNLFRQQSQAVISYEF